MKYTKYGFVLLVMCGAQAMDHRNIASYYQVPASKLEYCHCLGLNIVTARRQCLRAQLWPNKETNRRVMLVQGDGEPDLEVGTEFLKRYIPQTIIDLHKAPFSGQGRISSQRNGPLCAVATDKYVHVLDLVSEQHKFTVSDRFSLPNLDIAPDSKPDEVLATFKHVEFSLDGNYLAIMEQHKRARAFGRIRVFSVEDKQQVHEQFVDTRRKSWFDWCNIRLWWTPNNTLVAHLVTHFAFYDPETKKTRLVPTPFDYIGDPGCAADSGIITYKRYGPPQSREAFNTRVLGHEMYLLPNPIALEGLSPEQQRVIEHCATEGEVTAADITVLPHSLKAYLIARGVLTRAERA